MRLFFGFNLSSELTAILGRTQERLLRSVPVGFSPASLEQLHLTLLFLGERPDEELSVWKQALASSAAGINPFQISLLALGGFPSSKDPRVVWAGIEERSGQLKEIVSRLRTSSRAAGCKVEDREYTPHLTIGRNKMAKNATSLRLFIEREKVPGHRETIDGISLFESTPTPTGHRYAILSTAGLAAA